MIGSFGIYKTLNDAALHCNNLLSFGNPNNKIIHNIQKHKFEEVSEDKTTNVYLAAKKDSDSSLKLEFEKGCGSIHNWASNLKIVTNSDQRKRQYLITLYEKINNTKFKKTQGNQPSPKKQPPNNPALSLRQRLFGGKGNQKVHDNQNVTLY